MSNIPSACHQAEQGIVSLIGPVSSTAISQVAPVAEVLALPHLAPLASNPLLGKFARQLYDQTVIYYIQNNTIHFIYT